MKEIKLEEWQMCFPLNHENELKKFIAPAPFAEIKDNCFLFRESPSGLAPYELCLRVQDFDPYFPEETRKRILCVKDGKIVRYHPEHDEEDTFDKICYKDWDKPTPIVQICGLTENNEWFPFDNIYITVGDWWIGEKGTIYFCDCKTRGVSTEGFPSMSCEGVYEIDRELMKESDLILHLCDKEWFDERCYEDFKRAYFIGCKMARIKPVKQIKRR